MAPNFAHLLKRPAGKAKKPEALPVGNYPVIVKSYEYGDQNQKRTPYVRYHLGLTGWAETVDDSDKFMVDADGNRTPIDLSKRQPRRDYYLTDDAFWRLDKMLRDGGIEPDGHSGYEVYIPMVVGKTGTVSMMQKLDEKTGDTFNIVEELHLDAS